MNGLSVAVIELNDSTDTQANLIVAIDQLDRYMESEVDLFVPNLQLVVSEGMLTRVGSITSERSEIAKKIVGYHQFRAVRKARASVLARRDRDGQIEG